MNALGPVLALLALFSLFAAEIVHQRRVERREREAALNAWVADAFAGIGMDEASVKMRQFAASVNDFAIQIGEALIPAFRALGEAAAAIAPSLQAFADSYRAMVDDELATVGTLYYLDRRG